MKQTLALLMAAVLQASVVGFHHDLCSPDVTSGTEPVAMCVEGEADEPLQEERIGDSEHAALRERRRLPSHARAPTTQLLSQNLPYPPTDLPLRR